MSLFKIGDKVKVITILSIFSNQHHLNKQGTVSQVRENVEFISKKHSSIKDTTVYGLDIEGTYSEFIEQELEMVDANDTL